MIDAATFGQRTLMVTPGLDPLSLSIAECRSRIRSGTLTAAALLQACLARIEQFEKSINAFIQVTESEARKDADAADLSVQGGPMRRLSGIPVALKDNIDVLGVLTTNGRPGGGVAASDAEAVRRLREAGAVILGKVNLHECAMGATTDNAHFGRTMNPHGADCTPGGSSGGSAAAVAAGFCLAALGTDTMGSVRIPASYSGVVGFKPSAGLISMSGVKPLTRRFDTLGTFTRTVRDAAILCDTLVGFDPSYSESRDLHRTNDYEAELDRPLRPLKIGVMRNLATVKIEDEVFSAFRDAVARFKTLGCTVEEIELRDYDPGRTRLAGFLYVEAEAALIHGADYERAPKTFSKEIGGYIEFGRKVTAVQLLKAQQRVDHAAAELRRAMESIDMLISPTTPQAAFPFTSPIPDNQGDLTSIANFAGAPAISVPMGTDSRGMPMGLQIIGRVDQDRVVLRLADAYEEATGRRSFAPAMPMAGRPHVEQGGRARRGRAV